MGEKIDVLKKTAKKVIPEKVSKTIEKSVQTGIDFLSSVWEKRKLLKDEAKKKVRKNLLDFNIKIANLWKKPEFETKGNQISCWEKNDYQRQRRISSK